MEKFTESSGLGISLEANSGHHYIRSVLPEGPVGRCDKLFSGDELLEVKCCLELVKWHHFTRYLNTRYTHFGK